MSQNSNSQRLHEALTQLIADTNPGGRLPSEPVLAQELGISRATLREAMRIFEVQGMITRRQGSGTYVSHPSRVIETGLEVLESIETLARRSGLPVTMGSLEVETRSPTEEERNALVIQANIYVTRVARLILAENRPVAYLIDVLPSEILPPVELKSGFTGSVLDLLLRRGDPTLMVSKTHICASLADRMLARRMRIQRGDMLLCFIAELFDNTGRVVDYSHSYFLPGYFHFHVNRKVG